MTTRRMKKTGCDPLINDVRSSDDETHGVREVVMISYVGFNNKI